MLNNVRTMRLKNVLQKGLASIFLRNNMRYIDIKEVRISKCLQHATIEISSFDYSISDEEMLKTLEARMGFIKKNLALNLKLKYFPKLRFVLDTHRERIYALEELMKKISVEDQNSTDEK